MALSGLKPPAQLVLDGNLAQNWKFWHSAFEIYAGAAGVTSKPEKVQCCVFLHVAGPEAQKLFHTFTIADGDRHKIKPLTEAFEEYCTGKCNTTVVRFKFNSYHQTTQCMETYIRELKQRIAYCEYGELESTLLRDKLVCGVRDDALRDKLLQTPNLDLPKCLEICRMSEHNTALLRGTNTNLAETQIDAITKDNRRWTRPPVPAGRAKGRSLPQRQTNINSECDKCGYRHVRGTCPARGKQCASCQKIGHFAKVCRGRRLKAAPVDEIRIDKNNTLDEWMLAPDDEEEGLEYDGDLWQ